MAKKRSTTPRSDAIAAKHALWDAKCRFMSGTWPELCALKCSTCNSRAKFVISEYAFSKNAEDRLLTCNCGNKLVWFTLKGPAS